MAKNVKGDLKINKEKENEDIKRSSLWKRGESSEAAGEWPGAEANDGYGDYKRGGSVCQESGSIWRSDRSDGKGI